MIALRLEFLAGKFHANPWDRGTNEGEVEWPPSPWRMLRAITAGWHRSGCPDPEHFVRVVDMLAEPPTYDLPRATAGHSRHYVPLGGLKNGKAEKTLMLDSFLTIERGSEPVATAFVSWPRVSLERQEREVLERACATIGYLGRAESWCAISVVDAFDHRDWMAVVDLASRSLGEGTVVRRLAAGPNLRGVGLLESLTETTREMRRAKRLVPRGTAWVDYLLPPDFLMVMVREQYEARERDAEGFGPTILRFNLERAAASVLPPVTHSVSIAEVMRRAVMARYSAVNGGAATTRLAGKSDDGVQHREGHDHPFYLPFDSNRGGIIDRIDVWFPKGCTHAEHRAVTSVTALRDRFAFDGELALTFVGIVRPPQARVWESATPVILERFPKTRGEGENRRVIDPPSDQLRAMLERLGVEPFDLEVWPQGQGISRRGSHGTRLDSFRRARRGEVPTHPAIGATLHFAREIEGPIVLGRLAHFGLGLFRPA